MYSKSAVTRDTRTSVPLQATLGTLAPDGSRMRPQALPAYLSQTKLVHPLDTASPSTFRREACRYQITPVPQDHCGILQIHSRWIWRRQSLVPPKWPSEHLLGAHRRERKWRVGGYHGSRAQACSRKHRLKALLAGWLPRDCSRFLSHLMNWWDLLGSLSDGSCNLCAKVR